MSHFPEWMDKEEQRICNKLITAILSEEGRRIAVIDGMERVTGLTRNRALIQKETCQTDITYYEVYNPPVDNLSEYVGRFMLIHGNGEDVISDWSWRPSVYRSEEVMDEIAAMVDPIFAK